MDPVMGDPVIGDVMDFMGHDFTPLTQGQIMARLLAWPQGASFAYLVTPNADHLARLRRVPALRVVYARALYRLLDSRCLWHAATRLGLPAPPVVTGADLTHALLPHLAGRRVAVLGMRPSVIAALARHYPDITFLHHAPPMRLLYKRDAFFAAVSFAESARTDFVFLALGAPVQEMLAYALARRRRACGFGLCVGAALEFASGQRARAPLWMRKAGLEWMHRLLCEPHRLAGRYISALGYLLPSLLKAAIRQKWS